jgi:hypothetical protein
MVRTMKTKKRHGAYPDAVAEAATLLVTRATLPPDGDAAAQRDYQAAIIRAVTAAGGILEVDGQPMMRRQVLRGVIRDMLALMRRLLLDKVGEKGPVASQMAAAVQRIEAREEILPNSTEAPDGDRENRSPFALEPVRIAPSSRQDRV